MQRDADDRCLAGGLQVPACRTDMETYPAGWLGLVVLQHVSRRNTQDYIYIQYIHIERLEEQATNYKYQHAQGKAKKLDMCIRFRANLGVFLFILTKKTRNAKSEKSEMKNASCLYLNEVENRIEIG